MDISEASTLLRLLGARKGAIGTVGDLLDLCRDGWQGRLGSRLKKWSCTTTSSSSSSYHRHHHRHRHRHHHHRHRHRHHHHHHLHHHHHHRHRHRHRHHHHHQLVGQQKHIQHHPLLGGRVVFLILPPPEGRQAGRWKDSSRHIAAIGQSQAAVQRSKGTT